MYTAVFEELGKLKPGDGILLQTGDRTWEYQVGQVLILPLLGASAEQQAAYQVYLQPTTEPRLTLISCWPPVSNTHRVVVIAYLAQNP
jgi:LPXTG-site transpeptidase (sortase) family protein